MANGTILVVDDERDIVETLRFSLEQEGYNVITAKDGEEGLSRAREAEPDLIILDVMMPKENGYRVAQAIREDHGLGGIEKRISIILLTARNLGADPDREKSIRDFTQADALLYKPFEMDELLKWVRRLVPAAARSIPRVNR